MYHTFMVKSKSKAVRKKRKPLTEKQAIFVKTLSDTMSLKEAQITAYKPTTKKALKRAREDGVKTLKNVAIRELMDDSKIGLSDDVLLHRLKRALMAKKLVWSRSQEDWLEEVDWATQVKALELAFKLKGHLNSKSFDIDVTGAKEINVTFNLVKARSIDEIARLTDQTSIAKGRIAVVEEPKDEKPIDSEVVEEDEDGKNIQ